MCWIKFGILEHKVLIWIYKEDKPQKHTHQGVCLSSGGVTTMILQLIKLTKGLK